MNMLYKPLLDLFFAAFFLIILSPLMLIIALLVLILDGSPIFFRQERPGYREKLFVIYKFRTMKDARVTRIGRFLRSTSLDELPELWNILKGQMSFVGPRPLLTKYLPLYNLSQRKRHAVKPGLTGLAQINGRSSISWEKKFEFDVYYVENVSFILDLKIILKTIYIVLKRDGTNNDDEEQSFEPILPPH